MTTNARQRMLHTFSIDHSSTVDDRQYEGSFTTKKLTIRDLAALGVRKAQLNGGMHYDPSKGGAGIDEQTDEFNNMLAHLELSLVKTPNWWNLDEITDIQLLGKIYREVLTFENSFLRPRGLDAVSGQDTGGSSEGNSTKAKEQADTSGKPTTLVDNKVHAALEP